MSVTEALESIRKIPEDWWCEHEGQSRVLDYHKVAAALTWQPIETAPKDGTAILAYSEPAGTNVLMVRHIAMIDFLTDCEIEDYAKDGASDDMLETADWFMADFIHGDRLSPDCYPTHWMPIPALPKVNS